MKYALLILMAFAFVSCEEDEEIAISISGQVVDGETQLGMADISVEVRGYKTKICAYDDCDEVVTKDTVKTDAMGKFTFTAIKPKQVDYYDVSPVLPAPATGGFQECIFTKDKAAAGSEDILITVWCNEN